jgi:folate-dependent tRNA-U54 methylase TrmFO/GidA
MEREKFRQASSLDMDIYWAKGKIASLNETDYIQGTEIKLMGKYINITEEEFNHIKEYLINNALKELEKFEKEFEEL